MIYAQFFQQSALNKGELIEASGDRSVIILDGRNDVLTHAAIANRTAKERGYQAYQIMRGESFTRSKPAAPPVCLPVMYVMGRDPENGGRLLAMSNVAYTDRAHAEHMRDGCVSSYGAFIVDAPALKISGT